MCCAKKAKKNKFFMVFFMQQNLRPHVNMRKALTQIFGIGPFISHQLCDQLGFSRIMPVKQVSRSQLDQLGRVIGRYHVTGQELKRLVAQDIARFARISNYKGFRFAQGLPVRGQRTHTNARSTRKKQKPALLRKKK
jgi:small subunit ribosomal protein S13